jgi:Putative MetA-pathway of phenol degradation
VRSRKIRALRKLTLGLPPCFGKRRQGLCAGADDSAKPPVLPWVKGCLTQAFIALMAFSLAVILVPASVKAESPDAGAGEAQPPESLRQNNGFDLTRPQTAFEVRGIDRGSSNDTSKTNRARALLRIESKIPLNADWRLGLLAQVPLVGKTTTNFNPPSVTHVFGLGDANFEGAVAHDLNDRWAFGIGARVSAQTGTDSLGNREWLTEPRLGVRYMLFELGPDSYFAPSMRWP